MPSQLLFLFDLDQSLPLRQLDRGGGDDSSLQRDISALKHACLRLLASFCHVHGVQCTRQEVVHFGFRFYSSTGYFVPPAESSRPSFEPLSEESYDRLSLALSDHFERLLETSKTNLFDGQDMQKHFWSPDRKSEASSMRKALEEIAILFDWDSPNLHSPVKGRGRDGFQNVIFVFTKLPSSGKELSNFFNPGQATKSWNSREVYHEMFGKGAAKNIVNLLRGDLGVALNLVDTSSIYADWLEAKKAIKETLCNSLRSLKGGKLICFSGLSSSAADCVNCFEDWFVPQSRPFAHYVKKIEEHDCVQGKDQQRLLKLLQKSYHPKTSRVELSRPGKRKAVSSSLLLGEKQEKIRRRFSDESIVSQASRKSEGTTAKNRVSRGVEMLRLSSQTVESRRSNMRNREGGTADEKVAAASRLNEVERRSVVQQLEKLLHNSIVLADAAGVSEQLVQDLMRLQHEALSFDRSDLALTCLAEVTVSSLLRHLQATGRLKTSVEEIMDENFLVDPSMVGSRKTSLAKDGRTRDHKLQVLYRIEVHWLLASQFKQREFEAQMLVHLHQISIWDTPSELLHFMQATITSTYSVRQPELLAYLFDELSLTKPKELNLFNSPSKMSHCSSVAPSSVMSATSELSFSSKVQTKLVPVEDILSMQVSQAQQAKMEKLKRRLQGFDNCQQLQINIKSKKDKGKSVRPITASRIKFQRVPKRSEKEGARNSTKKLKESSKQAHKAKRNLSFDIAVRKSPRKKLAATPQKSVRVIAAKQPPTTPRRFTPNKTHTVLVPETPSSKMGRRKSDGTTVVHESPDVGAAKFAKSTPRTKRLRDSLRRNMFYADDHEGKKATSRNVRKTEEILEASKFLSNTDSETSKSMTNSQGIRRHSSMHTLFPHLWNLDPEAQEDVAGHSRNPAHCSPPLICNEDHDGSAVFSYLQQQRTPLKDHVSEKTPTKSSAGKSDFFLSPGGRRSRVSFNMTVQPPTPRSNGKMQTKGILKTPLKSEQESKVKTMLFASPHKTYPSQEFFSSMALKLANNSFATPVKSLAVDKMVEELASPKVVKPVSDAILRDDEEEEKKKASSPIGKKSYGSVGNGNRKSGFSDECNASSIRRSPRQEMQINDEVRYSLEPLEKVENSNDDDKAVVHDDVTNTTSQESCITGGDNTPMRPHRCRSLVNRFGIDDITLGEMISPEPPKKRAIPRTLSSSPMRPPPCQSPSPRNPVKRTRSLGAKRSLDKQQQRNNVVPQLVLDSDTTIMTDWYKPKQRSSSHSLSVDVGPETETHGSKCIGSPEKPPLASSSSISARSPLKSPGKFWSVATIQESPMGAISIKMNRRKKPDQQRQQPCVQRLSRSACQEMGISPNRIRRLIIGESPSPKRPAALSKEVAQGKENQGECYSPTVGNRRTVDINLTPKYSPLTSMGIYSVLSSPLVDHLTTPKGKEGERGGGSGQNVAADTSSSSSSSPRTRRKVNKKLYADSSA